MGATRDEIVRLVLLQSAKPAILDTLRITMGWAWTYLVVAELVASQFGAGLRDIEGAAFPEDRHDLRRHHPDRCHRTADGPGCSAWLHRRAFPYMHFKR
ncbi:MAG: hypothetical protein V9G29_06455 [Burkholderiaceae bacterium]